MAQIEPLRGIRYNPSHFPGGDLSPVVAPPYDVLSAQDKERLLQGSDRNIVAIDLPVIPADHAGPDAAYAQAASTLAGWLNDGTLIQESVPAIYAYSQTFDHDGQTHTRRGFIARLRLEEFGQGQVYPHEETFSGPKADRLKLTQACRANLSQVFVLFSHGSAVTDELYRGLGDRPDAHAHLGDVQHRLWVVSDRNMIAQLKDGMKAAAVYIADGHHRYTTSLNYRRWLAETQGTLPPDHPAHYVTCVFVSADDPGLLVLPTHRLVRGLAGFDLHGFRGHTKHAFDWESLEGQPPDWPEILNDAGPHAFGLVDGTTGGRFVLRLRRPDLLAHYEPHRCRAWQQLDVAILHRYLLSEVLIPRYRAARPPDVSYFKDAAAADAAACRHANALAFLLSATPVTAIRSVCSAGEVMPHKSTYFYPKVATGLVINPLNTA